MQTRPLSICVILALVSVAQAQLAVTANDAHWTLVNGVQAAVKNPPPDSVSIIDLTANPPKLVAEIEGVPASVIGPPLSVAVAPDESIALVTACMKLDPADSTKQIEDNRVSVIDLKSNPPKVIATLQAGKGPAGVSINRQGTLALVANRGDGSVSIFTINGKTVAPAGKFAVIPEPAAAVTAALAHVTFAPDGKTALLSRDGDHTITILSIDGTSMKLAGRDMRPGLRPYAVDINRDGTIAVTGNVGPGNGDSDTVSLMDLRAQPPRVVDVIAVGQTPEAAKLSPDGKWCAVVLQNGANKPSDSPFYADHGKLVLLKVDGMKLSKVAEAPTGHWSQGVAFSSDGKTIAVTNMIEKDVQIFQFDGASLRDTGTRLKLKGGPAAIRTAER